MMFLAPCGTYTTRRLHDGIGTPPNPPTACPPTPNPPTACPPTPNPPTACPPTACPDDGLDAEVGVEPGEVGVEVGEVGVVGVVLIETALRARCEVGVGVVSLPPVAPPRLVVNILPLMDRGVS